MGDKSRIEWTDATWNPLRARSLADGKTGWHCVKVSPACTNCYAEAFNLRRLPAGGTGLTYHRNSAVETYLDDTTALQPLRWRRPRKIFPCSMTDLFGEWAPTEIIDRMLAVMALARRHTFQVLTKRAGRLADVVSSLVKEVRLAAVTGHGSARWDAARKWLRDTLLRAGWRENEKLAEYVGVIMAHQPFPIPNVWFGVTVENQECADERIPLLLKTPAAVRFVSAEPLLGPLSLTEVQVERIAEVDCLNGKTGVYRPLLGDCANIDWVIAGGESGKNARPMHPTWARELRDQCVAAGVPFFFKQWGEWVDLHQSAECRDARENGHNPGFCPIGLDGKPVPCSADRSRGEVTVYRFGKKAAGRLLDGREWSEFPK